MEQSASGQVAAGRAAFDAQWYVERYPDVQRSRLSPAEHFERVGLLLGRAPNAATTRSARTNDQIVHARGQSVKVPRPRLDAHARQAIVAAGLFDEHHYRRHTAAALAEGTDPLDHYLAHEDDPDVAPPCALFSSRRYLAENPDIGTFSPLAHAALYGLGEGRRTFDPALIDGYLAEHAATPCARLGEVIDLARPALIFCWDEGNFFFAEIAAYLEVLLVRLGVDARQARCDELPGADVTPIVVAPHEFCIYGEGRSWPDALLARTVSLNTEQWHTGWFTHSLRFLRKSGLGLDINPTSASGLNALGCKVAFIPMIELAGSPFAVERAALSADFAAGRDIEPLTFPAAARERAYDVLFVGACNARRAALLAALAPVLSQWTTFLHCPRLGGPVLDGNPDAMKTRDAVQLARNSRILLNIHQSESHYFEWHRLYLLGIAKGCVVVSEPCLPNAWVHEGTHYIGCAANDIGPTVAWLLGTPEGAAQCDRIARNCAELVERLNDIKAALL
jgi:hypothetical protein